jgi:hypothetical protein
VALRSYRIGLQTVGVFGRISHVVRNACCTAAAREMYTECRQALASQGVAVYAAPCSATDSAVVWPGKLPNCSRFEYVVNEAVSNCQNATAEKCSWIKVRYQDEAGRLQTGWVTASCNGVAMVARCPAAVCLKGKMGVCIRCSAEPAGRQAAGFYGKHEAFAGS